VTEIVTLRGMTYPTPQQPQQQYGAPQGYAPPQQHPGYQQPGYQPHPGYQQQAYQQQAVVSAEFLKHTGALIWWQQSTVRVQGSFEDVTAAYKKAQLHCLTLGWWSISSVVAFNWIALISNVIAYGRVKKAAGR
jgi:hypothetical protein